ncbi:MAG TPA: pirin family protein [Edaphocola sp.]|nr:pirin family protein [Edaphocola sp.]
MMSNIGLVIEERSANIGNFMVGRLLPFKEKRMVGPFIFIDHMGPTCMAAYQNLDVPPHPHIGLATLTYLFEGAIWHRDSMGNSLEIHPGAVNWMTAGSGVVHSERTPEALRQEDKMLHGFQIWVALPKEREDAPPSFVHIGANELPVWSEGAVHYKLIAGTLGGRQSPVPVYSPLYFMEIKAEQDADINIGDELFGEVGMYILEGAVAIEGSQFGTRQLLIAKDSRLCRFTIRAGSTVYLFGGEPLTEERFVFWNFVHSNKERIRAAMQAWEQQDWDVFPIVPGDESEFVPLPPLNNIRF